jgi:hypothetical protein
VFKFVSKGDAHDNESALFYNGQRILTTYATVNVGGEIMVQIEDGSGHLTGEWEDFLEESD